MANEHAAHCDCPENQQKGQPNLAGALAFNGVDGIGYVYMAAICAGALMLILSSFFLIAGNVKRKREEQERQRRLIERERADRMRARRAYGYR